MLLIQINKQFKNVKKVHSVYWTFLINFHTLQITARIEHMEMKNGNGATQNGNSFRPEEPKRDPKVGA